MIRQKVKSAEYKSVSEKKMKDTILSLIKQGVVDTTKLKASMLVSLGLKEKQA